MAINHKEILIKSLIKDFSIETTPNVYAKYGNFADLLPKKNDVYVTYLPDQNSENVVKAMRFAKKQGALCIGITGMSGGLLKKICDECIIVPSNDMLSIESIHLLLCHYIVSSIRNHGTPIFKYE